MTPTKSYPLGKLCIPTRNIVAPDSADAAHLRYVGMEHIESGTGRIVSTAASEMPAAEIASATFRFDGSHVLYGKLRPYLNKVALPDFKGRCSTEVIPLQPTGLITREYLALLLRSDVVINAAQRSGTGSRMPRADMNTLLKVELPVA